MARKKRLPYFINLVPLLDVLIILLFFFLLTMQLPGINTLKVDLPSAQNAESALQEQEALLITINKKGLYSLGKQENWLNSDQLHPALADYLKNHGAPSQVLVLSDAQAPVQSLTKTMDLARAFKLANIQLKVNVERT